MKMKTVRTSALKYAKRVRILASEYEDGSLYVGILTMSGEDYCDITTHLQSLPVPFGFVECNSDAERFIFEQKLANDAQQVIKSGFKTYRMYRFNIDDPAMKEVG